MLEILRRAAVLNRGGTFFHPYISKTIHNKVEKSSGIKKNSALSHGVQVRYVLSLDNFDLERFIDFVVFDQPIYVV